MSVKLQHVYLIMVRKKDGSSRRVGKVHRTRTSANDWRLFAQKGQRGTASWIEKVVIESVDGQPSEASVRLFDERYNIDLTGKTTVVTP